MSSQQFKMLINAAVRGIHKICMPRIVLEEIKNKYKEEAEKAIKKVRREHHTLGRLLRDRGNDYWKEPDGNRIVQEYSDWLNKKIEKIGAHVLEYPKTEHCNIARRLVRKEKPFDEAGKGYRDVLIWESIKELAVRDSEEGIAFVTCDVRGYRDENGDLRTNLRADLVSANIGEGNVEVFWGLKEFNQKRTRPDLQRIENIEYELETKDYKEGFLASEIETWMNAMATNDEYEGEELGLPYDAQSVVMTNVENVRINEIEDVRDLGNREASIEMDVVFDANLEFFIDHAYAVGILDDEESKIQIAEFNWNDYSSLATTVKEIYADIEVIINLRNGEVKSVEISRITNN